MQPDLIIAKYIHSQKRTHTQNDDRPLNFKILAGKENDDTRDVHHKVTTYADDI